MANNVYQKVWQLTRLIPCGRVVTYGNLARQLGLKDSRIIGWALHANHDPGIPCYRVINRNGGIAKNYALGGWRRQRKQLLKEKVKFIDAKRVDLSKFGIWGN